VIVALLNQMGEVGRTTQAVDLAREQAGRGQRVIFANAAGTDWFFSEIDEAAATALNIAALADEVGRIAP
jgi:hypothetical protein